MNRVQLAARQVRAAIEQLQFAKANLRAARNDQHIAVALQLAALEEIYDILMDPECTPEIAKTE